MGFRFLTPRRRWGENGKRRLRTFPAVPIWGCLFLVVPNAWSGLDVRQVIEKMDSAYARISNYQATLEIRTHTSRGNVEEKRLRYAFQKPYRIRLDFESPHPGMIVIYPYKDGKVRVRPGGLLRFLTLTLDPSSSLLEASPGQRIDQTDLGLLIRNISRSVAAPLEGDPAVFFDPAQIRIRVTAENHFRPDIRTRYTFRIDRNLWLPDGVREESAEGILKRTVEFLGLAVNTGIRDEFFEVD